MAISSSLRSRRFSNRQTEDIQHLVIFQLRQEWFAIKAVTVHKVIPLAKVYGDPHHTGISLTNYQDQEILVIDVGYKIFGETPQALENSNLSQPKFLVIFSSAQGELTGLPIDSSPMIRRIPQSAFTAIPDTYISSGNIRCLSNQMIKTDDLPPVFELDPFQLINSYR